MGHARINCHRKDTMTVAWCMFDEAMRWEYKAYVSLLKGGNGDKYWYLTYKGIANIYLNKAAENELLALEGKSALSPPNRKVIERHFKRSQYGDAHACA